MSGINWEAEQCLQQGLGDTPDNHSQQPGREIGGWLWFLQLVSKTVHVSSTGSLTGFLVCAEWCILLILATCIFYLVTNISFPVLICAVSLYVRQENQLCKL